jgi:hypothetical protein
MQITIDDETLHEWARENGYVQTEVLDRIRELVSTPTQRALAAACEQVGGMLPQLSTITRKEVDAAFRAVIDHYTDKNLPASEGSNAAAPAGRALLKLFGANKISDIREDQFVAFMARANSRHQYQKIEDYVASLKPADMP